MQVRVAGLAGLLFLACFATVSASDSSEAAQARVETFDDGETGEVSAPFDPTEDVGNESGSGDDTEELEIDESGTMLTASDVASLRPLAEISEPDTCYSYDDEIRRAAEPEIIPHDSAYASEEIVTTMVGELGDGEEEVPSTPRDGVLLQLSAKTSLEFNGGRYKDCVKLGSGSYGRVYKCKVRGSDPPKYVAVKEYKAGKSKNAAHARALASREAEIELFFGKEVFTDNNYCVRIEGVFHDENGVPHLVQEFGGTSLTKFQMDESTLQNTPTGVKLFADADFHMALSKQLIEAIKYTSDLGVVHADLKGDNVVYGPPAGAGDDRARIRLIDYGMNYCPVASSECGKLNPKTSDTMYKGGTEIYSPPESFGPKFNGRLYGDKVFAYDMFAAGLMMLEFAIGAPLYYTAPISYQDSTCTPRTYRVVSPFSNTNSKATRLAEITGLCQIEKIKRLLAQNPGSFAGKSNALLDLLSRMLRVNWKTRIPPEMALKHVYCVNNGMPKKCKGKLWWVLGPKYEQCVREEAAAKEAAARGGDGGNIDGAKAPGLLPKPGFLRADRRDAAAAPARVPVVPAAPANARAGAFQIEDHSHCIEKSSVKYMNTCSYGLDVKLRCNYGKMNGRGNSLLTFTLKPNGSTSIRGMWITADCEVSGAFRRSK